VRWSCFAYSDNYLIDVKLGIAPHPVFDKSKRDDGTFSRGDFRYDPTDDVYHCPGGKRLGTGGTAHEGKTLPYRASKLDCVMPAQTAVLPKATITQDPARYRAIARIKIASCKNDA
jgi:hypothetical protein